MCIRDSETHYAVHIPWVMGLIGTRSLTIEIPGIEELVENAQGRIRRGSSAARRRRGCRAGGGLDGVAPDVRAAFEDNGQALGYALLLKRYVDDPRQATDAEIEKAAWDTVPNVPTLFWSFRLMVGLGFFFIALTALFFFLSARRRLDRYPLLLWVAVLAVPLPWIAAELGWVVAEFGRQPWIIEGVLPTAAAVSNLGAATLLTTIVGFALIYTVLFVIEMGLMLRAIRQGPHADDEPQATLLSPIVSPAE